MPSLVRLSIGKHNNDSEDGSPRTMNYVSYLGPSKVMSFVSLNEDVLHQIFSLLQPTDILVVKSVRSLALSACHILWTKYSCRLAERCIIHARAGPCGTRPPPT